jgi:hypothetical protein
MPTLYTALFNAASSSDTIAAAAVGAKALAMSTWPFWGLPLALILLSVFVKLILWMISKAKTATPGTGTLTPTDGVNSATYRPDYELTAAVRWNEAETKARREYSERQ